MTSTKESVMEWDIEEERLSSPVWWVGFGRLTLLSFVFSTSTHDTPRRSFVFLRPRAMLEHFSEMWMNDDGSEPETKKRHSCLSAQCRNHVVTTPSRLDYAYSTFPRNAKTIAAALFLPDFAFESRKRNGKAKSLILLRSGTAETISAFFVTRSFRPSFKKFRNMSNPSRQLSLRFVMAPSPVVAHHRAHLNMTSWDIECIHLSS